MNLDGTHVAMVTPLDKDNNVNEEEYRNLIDFLIEGGVEGILAAGTTGESATMSHDEHQKVIDIMVDQVNGRALNIAGAGSNATSEAMDLVKYAENAMKCSKDFCNAPGPKGAAEFIETAPHIMPDEDKKSIWREILPGMFALLYWLVAILFIVFFEKITGSNKWWIVAIVANVIFPLNKKLVSVVGMKLFS